MGGKPRKMISETPMVSIIIPARDEEKAILKCLNETIAVMDSAGFSYELIVVDDGSKDHTYEVAEEIARKIRRVKVLRCNLNLGKGYAVKKGFSKASGNLVMYMDADLSIHPKQIPTFISRMKDADIVVGSKRHPRSQIKYPLHRRFLSRCFNLLVRAMFKLRISDTQAGFKLFRREVLKEVLPRVLVKRYAFDVELLVNAYKRGYKMVEAPITVRHGEKERMTIRDVLRMVIDLLAIFYRLHFTKTV
jgi:glycosyltransferase involved in cell wall biosynthesis